MVIVTDKQYYISNHLKNTLDSYCHNLKKDWDFVILVSGCGQVRVGKSVLAQQVAYYVAQKMNTPFDVSNMCFSSKELIEKAHKSPINSVLVYDEARNALDAKKTMRATTQELLDFFAECGQYNNVIILVLPDFFELNKGLALTRSRVLLDVYTKNKKKFSNDGSTVVEFQRGYFRYFDFDKKRLLYLKGKERKNDYFCVKPLFHDRFNNIYTVDEKAYRHKKAETIKREVKDRKIDKFKMAMTAYSNLCKKKGGFTFVEQSKLLKEYGFGISSNRIADYARELRYTKSEDN